MVSEQGLIEWERWLDGGHISHFRDYLYNKKLHLPLLGQKSEDTEEAY